MSIKAMGYFDELEGIRKGMTVTDKDGREFEISKGFEMAVKMIIEIASTGSKLIFIGNGASASIASHQAVDYWKRGGVPAIAFNDHALLTCISNDLGYEHVFEKPIEMFARKGDVLIAISSSGRSKNILKAVEAAKRKGCSVITMSGFKEGNPLRQMGDVNFYVPSEAYGFVEISHLSICHCIIDYIEGLKK